MAFNEYLAWMRDSDGNKSRAVVHAANIKDAAEDASALAAREGGWEVISIELQESE